MADYVDYMVAATGLPGWRPSPRRRRPHRRGFLYAHFPTPFDAVCLMEQIERRRETDELLARIARAHANNYK
jgi:hypothetical protein